MFEAVSAYTCSLLCLHLDRNDRMSMCGLSLYWIMTNMDDPESDFPKKSNVLDVVDVNIEFY